jgi:hypothetical protein
MASGTFAHSVCPSGYCDLESEKLDEKDCHIFISAGSDGPVRAVVGTDTIPAHTFLGNAVPE